MVFSKRARLRVEGSVKLPAVRTALQHWATFCSGAEKSIKLHDAVGNHDQKDVSKVHL